MTTLSEARALIIEMTDALRRAAEYTCFEEKDARVIRRVYRKAVRILEEETR